MSLLPTSACSMSSRRLTGSKRPSTAMRLSTSCSSSPRAASTIEPPVSPSRHGAPACAGASACATSVKRLPPDTIWNGAASARRLASQSSVASARSISRRAFGSLASMIVPGPNESWPVARCGAPSRASSARRLSDTGRSASNWLASTRAASIKSRIISLRASMLTARRPSPSGFTPARSTHSRSVFSEPMRSTTSPPSCRVRLRLILSNFDCCPLRWSSTVRLPLLRPISPRSWPSRPSALMLSSQVSSAPRFSRLLRDGAAAAAGWAAGAAEPVRPRVSG